MIDQSKKPISYLQKDGSIVYKVFLQDTQKYQGRHFYMSVPKDATCQTSFNKTQSQLESEMLELLDNDKYNWFMHEEIDGRETIQGYSKKNGSRDKDLVLTRAIYQTYFNKTITDDDNINCINKVGFDCRDINLNKVSKNQITLSQETRGYNFTNNGFVTQIRLNGKVEYGSSCESESAACILQYNHELLYVRDSNINKNSDIVPYKYNILNDFRGFEVILDKLITREISEDDAILKLIQAERKHPYLSVRNSIADNAWYVFRYNLFEHFLKYKLPIPKYKLNEEGRMIHPKTKELLCPFKDVYNPSPK